MCSHSPFFAPTIYHLLDLYWLHWCCNILLPDWWWWWCTCRWRRKDQLRQCWQRALSLGDGNHRFHHLNHLILSHFHRAFIGFSWSFVGYPSAPDTKFPLYKHYCCHSLIISRLRRSVALICALVQPRLAFARLKVLDPLSVELGEVFFSRCPCRLDMLPTASSI